MQPLTKKKRVLIATPSIDGRVESSYAVSLAETLLVGACYNIEFVPVILSKNSIIQLARNELVNYAKELNADGMLWIDGDEGWDKMWPTRLVLHNLDVVTAAVPRKEEINSFCFKVIPFKKLHIDTRGLMEIDAVGTGFVYWSRKVIDHLWNNAEPYKTGEGIRRWIFDVVLDPKTRAPVGEDILVCRQLRAAGFRIYLDTTMSVEHVGSKSYVSDVRKWLVDIQKEMDEKSQKLDATLDNIFPVAKNPSLT